MIVPSIDIRGGRAVQLRRGREFVLDGGDPLERLERFAVVGEVAVVDLDAALGTGDNGALIREMVARAPCRVGGGIRTLDAARRWLDAGATRVVLGTAATPALCAALPRDRVIAAVDCEDGEVVVDGWRARTGRPVLDAIRELAPVVGGFLLTQVEHEGAMRGFDRGLVRAAVAAAGGARVTAAGGITTEEDVAALDAIGADAQVGMALYRDRLDLAAAFSAPIAARLGRDALWPTLVCDESDRLLGLAWSNAASLREAVRTRRGVYWSRSRDALWVKGASSGATQQLIRLALDCDRDALRATVRQSGVGFCHRGRRDCFDAAGAFDLGDLERVVRARRDHADPASGTRRLLEDPGLLAAKLQEEARELADAGQPGDAVHETADLIYLALVALVRGGGSLAEVQAELARRHRAVTRRPMEAKP